MSCSRSCAEFCENLRFRPDAIEALQTASEDMLVKIFEDPLLCTEHAECATVLPREIQLFQNIRGRKTTCSNPIDLW